MAESMAEIEQGALASLALVARHGQGLGSTAGRDRVLARRTTRERLAPVGLKPGEEGRITDETIFDDLGIAGAELARRQGVEQRGVGNHQDRLVEGADEVLAVARIDRGLAADR